MRLLAGVLLALCCAGCGGGGSHAVPGTQPGGPSSSGVASSTIQARITIPPSGGSATARQAQFVGAATNGVLIRSYLHSDTAHANPTGGGAYDLSSTSGLCTTSGSRTCTLSSPVGIGNSDVVFTTYDASPVSGSFVSAHQLGQGTVYGVQIANGTNALAVAIGGTVASIAVTPSSQSISGTSAGSYTLGFTAYDAQSEMIIAGATTVSNGGNTQIDSFSNPITFTVSESGGSGHTTLSLNGGAAASLVTAQNSSDTITVYYDGAASSGYSASIAAAATSASGASATLALLFGGKIYVADNAGNSLTVYAANPSGTLNEAPIATLFGGATGLLGPWGIALDASGNIYATNRSPYNSVTVYPANPSGSIDPSPLAAISGSNTGLGQPYGIALDASGKIYVANNVPQTTVTVYAANPNGTLNESPLATISGSNTGFTSFNYGIAVDASGRIYVVNGNSVLVFAANPSGTLNEAPIAIIGGSNTQLGNPYGIALDSSGRIYVTNTNGAQAGYVTVYAANPSGNLNETPVAMIAGSNTGLYTHYPYGIALDTSGKIYVSTYDNGSVTVYAANPSGTLNEVPLATISGGSTGLVQPFGIAVH
jgi:sugar lactone lactonase YvrE